MCDPKPAPGRLRKLALPATLVGALLLPAAAFADHPSRRETEIDDGGLVISKSFKTNRLIYRSIGGETTIKGKKKKRKWWCAWLCKRRVKRTADSISIQNTYFSETAPGIFVNLPREPRVCAEASSCRQRERAFGFGLDFDFTPGLIDELLPIDGVITVHRVIVDGEAPIVVSTSKGKHPGPVID